MGENLMSYADKQVLEMAGEGGGGGSTLPEVTSEDNGDVLTVVDGAWGKAKPISGVVFDLLYDETTYQINHSYTEILAAVQAGKIVRYYDEVNQTIYYLAIYWYTDSPSPGFEDYYNITLGAPCTETVAVFHSANSDTNMYIEGAGPQ